MTVVINPAHLASQQVRRKKIEIYVNSLLPIWLKREGRCVHERWKKTNSLRPTLVLSLIETSWYPLYAHSYLYVQGPIASG